MLPSSPLLLLAGAALTAAQSATTASPSGPVVSLFLPDTDPQKLVASVIDSSDSMTTYLITCPEGTDASDCGYSDPVTITEGASSLMYSQVRFCGSWQIVCALTCLILYRSFRTSRLRSTAPLHSQLEVYVSSPLGDQRQTSQDFQPLRWQLPTSPISQSQSPQVWLVVGRELLRRQGQEVRLDRSHRVHC